MQAGARKAWRWVWLLPLVGCARPAAANTGVMFIAGTTPLDWGWGYILSLFVIEAVVLKLMLGVPWRKAGRYSFSVNVISGVVGVAVTVMPFILALAQPLLSVLALCGIDQWHPVPRLIAVTLAYFLLSVLIEARLLAKEVPRRAAWRGSLLANAVTYVLGGVLLLFSPYPYQDSTDWRWMYTTRELNVALREYQASHHQALPPQGAGLELNRALAPYLTVNSGSPLIRGGKAIWYDRFRLHNDYPEIRLVVGKRHDGDPCIEAAETPWHREPGPPRAFPKLVAPVLRGP